MAVKNLRNSESYVARRHPAFARPHHQTREHVIPIITAPPTSSKLAASKEKPSTSEKVERHRKRKRKEKEGISFELDDTQNVVATGKTGQEERRKSKTKKSSPSKGVEDTGSIQTEKPPRVDEESLNVSETKEQLPEDKKRAKKRKLEQFPDKAQSSAEDKPKKAMIKRDETSTETVAPDDTPETSTKKRKNSTGFSDPRKDKELSDQAQRVLTYAFTQFYKPKKWKFNKARQNWLIRNLWSANEVPDIYFPLVVAYLAKVQGGTRENLLKSCNQALEVPLPVETSVTGPTPLFTDAASTPIVTAAEATQVKFTRAKAILEGMKAPEEHSTL